MRLVVLFVAVTALALASPSPSGAQRGRWEPRLVLTGGGIADVVFASESTAWAVGDGAIFLSGGTAAGHGEPCTRRRSN